MPSPRPRARDARARARWLIAAAAVGAAALAWGLWVSLDLHHPWLLILAIPVAPLLVWALFVRRTFAAVRYPTVSWTRGLRRTWRQRLAFIAPLLMLAAATLVVVASARPRKGIARSVIRREGIAIQMVLDRSGSMDEGIRYRGEMLPKIEVVKRIFKDFVIGAGDLPGRKTDLLGLTTFARFAEESCPLIGEYEPLIAAVDNLRTVPPYLDQYNHPTRNRSEAAAVNELNQTAIGDGLQRAVLSLVTAEEDLTRGGEEKGYAIEGKVAIVLTDGENNAGMDPIEAGRYAEANGIKVYFIVLLDPNEYVRTFAGPRVAGPRDPEEIAAILEAPEEVARLTGGRAFRASDGDELRDIYREIDRLERSEIGRIEFRSYEERYRILLVPAVALIALAFVLGETVFRRAP
ncbi:MAG: VWA domain-containing protein [Planctomycetes bacterium]|nr:VWA domain-containing protein [Planctomycetota bacterium]